jgi:cation-transporting ATPase E
MQFNWRDRRAIGITLLLVVAVALLGPLFYLWWRGRSRPIPAPPGAIPPDLTELEGLSTAEAEARRTTNLEEQRALEHARIRGAIRRSNIVSIFNLPLLGMTVANALLGAPLDALTSFAAACFNTGINIFQQSRTADRIEELAAQTRPSATALHDGIAKSVDQDDIVMGDVLVVGPGDQILADGRVLRSGNALSDLSAYTGRHHATPIQTGDPISTGDFCTAGWAAYEVQTPPTEIDTVRAVAETRAEQTPLQQVIFGILSVLLIILAIFFVLLVVDVVGQPELLTEEMEIAYREWAGFIFGIAPAGLFFMITLAYTAGALDLSKTGALVRDMLAIESLAQVTVLCFGKTGALTGQTVEVDIIPPPTNLPGLAENRIRQLLGATARSIQSDNAYVRTIAQALDGEKRAVEQQAPHLAVYGWMGLTFSDPDLRGAYVLGKPEILGDHISGAAQTHAEDDEDAQGSSRQAPATVVTLCRSSSACHNPRRFGH